MDMLNGSDAPPPRTGQRRHLRVEFCSASESAVLSEDELCYAHHRSLERFATHLRLAGTTEGELRLIEPVTGAIVARRQIQPRARKPFN